MRRAALLLVLLLPVTGCPRGGGTAPSAPEGEGPAGDPPPAGEGSPASPAAGAPAATPPAAAPTPSPPPDVAIRGRKRSAWEAGLRDADPAVRQQTLFALWGADGPDASCAPLGPALLELAGDPEQDLRRGAVNALGKIDPSLLTAAVERVVAAATDRNGARAGVGMASDLPAPARDRLLRQWLADPRPPVRQAAVEYARLASADAELLRALVEVAVSDPQADAWTALRALLDAQPGAAPTLTPQLVAAFERLQGGRERRELLQWASVLEVHHPGLSSRDLDRCYAVALGEDGPREVAVRALVHRGQRDAASVVALLRPILDGRAGPALEPAVEVARGLGPRGGELAGALHVLAREQTGADRSRRPKTAGGDAWRALRELGEGVEPRVPELLRDLEGASGEEARARAGSVLGAAGRASAVPLAEALARLRDGKALTEASNAFVNNPARLELAPEIVPHLIRALDDRHTVSAGVHGLASLGPAAAPATDALIVTLRGADDPLAAGCIAALGRIGRAAATARPDIEERAQVTEAGHVRFAIAVTLGQLGDSRAGPTLRQLISDPAPERYHGPTERDGEAAPEWTVAEAARRSLAKLGLR